jgi:AcrR family transcriptional regulator
MTITTSRQNTKKDKTQQLILDAAAKCFSKQGFHGTPLKDIAETVNMKAGSLYYHFPSKEMLMQEVLNKSVQLIYNTVKDEVAKLEHNAAFPELLRAAIRGHLIAILTYSDYTSASIRNYGQFPEAVHRASQSSRDDYEQFWRDFFDQAEAEGAIRTGVDKHLLRLTIFGGMNWASVWFESKDTDGASVESIADFQADLFLNGCRP